MPRASFSDLINSKDKPVLVDFHAEWCSPCKTMAPVIQEMAREMTDKLKVIKIDTDKNPAISEQYRIRGVPTFILFKDGKELWRASGAMPRQQLENQLKPFIA